MAKTVQIPVELFERLCDFFLGSSELDEYDLDELFKTIHDGLQAKQDAITARELYSQSKSRKASSAQREAARQAYLDHRGIPDSFRWKKGEEP